MAFLSPLHRTSLNSWSNRLTSASPFIQDENQRDMKVRIANRTIDWSSLDNLQITELGKWKHLPVTHQLSSPLSI